MNNLLTAKTISRRSFVGAHALAGAAAVAGCSAEGSGSGSAAGGSTGGTLNISLAASPAYLDPVKYTGIYESQIINSVCDPLVQYSMDLSEIVPCLATDWTISDDGMTYTFNLRDDAKFQAGEYQDGRAMTAEDVKWSLERSATSTCSTTATSSPTPRSSACSRAPTRRF